VPDGLQEDLAVIEYLDLAFVARYPGAIHTWFVGYSNWLVADLNALKNGKV
jgi:hypothetical protein